MDHALIEKAVTAMMDPDANASVYGHEFWGKCSPNERMAALEMMRRTVWGYGDDARMDRSVIEVVRWEDLDD